MEQPSFYLNWIDRIAETPGQAVWGNSRTARNSKRKRSQAVQDSYALVNLALDFTLAIGGFAEITRLGRLIRAGNKPK